MARAAIPLPGTIQNALDGLVPVITSAEVAAAYAALTPVLYQEAATVSITIDLASAANATARQTMIQSAATWLGRSIIANGEIRFVIPDGYWTLDGNYITHKGSAPKLIMEGTAQPDFRDIASIAFAATGTASRYTVTVGVTSALPSQVVAGFPIGCQNVVGDNDASTITGGLRVQTIAVDRLSFTALLWRKKGAPTNPTTIDIAGSDSSMRRSRLVIPKAALAPISGWDGGAIEGWLNLEGGEARLKWLGITYAGVATVGCMIMVKRGGGLELEDYCALVGGPERVLRGFGGFSIYSNRSCIGGAGAAEQEMLITQNAGEVSSIRSSWGGAVESVVILGDSTHGYMPQSFIAGGINTVYVSGDGSANLQSSRISDGTRGIYAVRGRVAVDTSTKVERCSTGLAWQAAGYILGNPAFTGNTSGSQAPGNILDWGGGWYQDQLKGLIDRGVRASVPDGTAWEAPLSGIGGIIVLAPETLPQYAMLIAVDIVSPSTIAVSIFTGSKMHLDTGEIVAPLFPGDATVSVYLDGSTYRLRVLNESGGTRIWRAVGQGDIVIGAFVAG